MRNLGAILGGIILALILLGAVITPRSIPVSNAVERVTARAIVDDPVSLQAKATWYNKDLVIISWQGANLDDVFIYRIPDPTQTGFFLIGTGGNSGSITLAPHSNRDYGEIPNITDYYLLQGHNINPNISASILISTTVYVPNYNVFLPIAKRGN